MGGGGETLMKMKLILTLSLGLASCFVGNAFTTHNSVRTHYYAARTLHRQVRTSATPGPNLVSTDTISVMLPDDWENDNSAYASSSWPEEASSILHEHGMVALRSSDSSRDGVRLIDEGVCDDANDSAASRVDNMHRRIASRGMDPDGIDEPYRFAEMICRDAGGNRFDVPVPWLGGDDGNRGDEAEEGGKGTMTDNRRQVVGSGRLGAPLQPEEEEGIAALHHRVGRIVSPVLDVLWPSPQSSPNAKTSSDSAVDDVSSSSYVAAAGFLVNRPGSKSQNWHRDGPDEGYVDCFVPLVDLNEELGPTAIKPGTHNVEGNRSAAADDDDEKKENELVPMLNKGDVLLFDYRTLHRGQGNTSESTTRALAYAVYRRHEEGATFVSGSSGDVHNFPAALTLEYD